MRLAPPLQRLLSKYRKTSPTDPTIKLPIEILLYTFQQCPPTDIVRLIRVNHFFYETLHPLLFETLNFHSDKSCKRAMAACNLIIRNPALGKAVLRFDPAGGVQRRRAERIQKVSKVQSQAIALMPNLTDMNIWGRAILPHHLVDIITHPAPRLRRLTLMQVIPEEWIWVVPLLVRAHPLLTELRLWPTLRADQFSDLSPGFTLERSDAPKLRSFTGSLPVLGGLLQDGEEKERVQTETGAVEPITHATIASPILLHEHFEALDVLRANGSSLRSFQCHVVVANWHAMEVIAKALPQLEVLKLHVLANFKRDRFVEFMGQVEGLEHFTQLRELHLNSRDVTVLHRTAFRKKNVELEVVTRLGEQCKTLKVITMPPYRRWVRQDDGVWNVLSGQELHEHINFVKSQLGRPNDGQLGRRLEGRSGGSGI
ncbi:hypothetical protein BDV93DRAFT_525656 [Ceratobasidium sp. AG-I]|nr:hypothetical protein BDV93DRAFT_525656 [Ceratobasidium sp. AG-I]